MSSDYQAVRVAWLALQVVRFWGCEGHLSAPRHRPRGSERIRSDNAHVIKTSECQYLEDLQKTKIICIEDTVSDLPDLLAKLFCLGKLVARWLYKSESVLTLMARIIKYCSLWIGRRQLEPSSCYITQLHSFAE